MKNQKTQLILNGNLEAKKVFKSLKHKLANKKNKIGLAIILIGKNPASQVYVKIKEKRAKEIGINFKKYILPASVSQKKILELIKKLNQDKTTYGILIQLPLPKKFNTNKIIKEIDKAKDVDGFVSKKIISPTIQSIIHLIKLSKTKLQSKKIPATRSPQDERAIILANSLEFAKPLKKELNKNNITSVDIILKSKIRNQKLKIKDYNIIIIAFGKKHWLKPKMIKKNTIVIDVGINKIKNSKKIFGDVHPGCFKKSKYISPVPGGVGPLTVAFLFKNLVKLVDKK